MSYTPDAVCAARWAAQTSEGDDRNAEPLAAYLRKLLVSRFGQLGLNEDEAQELAQETLIDVMQNLAKFDAGKGMLSSWVGGFARTSVRSWRRREYGRRAVEIPIDIAPEMAVEDEGIGEVETAVGGSVSKLHLIDQELLYMRFHLGLSFDEIAEQTDMTSVNARKRISRAVDKLRRDPDIRAALGL